jgi:hypothetical protein
MASGSSILLVSEIFRQHDQELVDRFQKTHQGSRGDLVREIRESTP